MKISETEFEQLLKVHDTDVYVQERPAYRLLEDSALRYPDRTALIAADRTRKIKKRRKGFTISVSGASLILFRGL